MNRQATGLGKDGPPAPLDNGSSLMDSDGAEVALAVAAPVGGQGEDLGETMEAKLKEDLKAQAKGPVLNPIEMASPSEARRTRYSNRPLSPRVNPKFTPSRPGRLRARSNPAA